MFGQLLTKMATAFAIIGGLVLLTMVIINVLSITGRVLFAKPLVGDFELIEMGCATAIFMFMPLCQLKKGNIIIDFFTTKLSEKKKHFLDEINTLIFAVVATFFAWRMCFGAWDMIKYEEQTMLLQLSVWIPFFPAIFSFFLLSLICFYSCYQNIKADKAKD